MLALVDMIRNENKMYINMGRKEGKKAELFRNSQKSFKNKYANITNKWSYKINRRRNRKNKNIKNKVQVFSKNTCTFFNLYI